MRMIDQMFSPVNIVFIAIWVMIASSPSHGVQSDVDCLKSMKTSIIDPNNYLSSWRFDNSTKGFICRFTGISCWHDDENRVLNIKLSDMGLRGEFPPGIKNCTSLTGLDLSNNLFSGPLPVNISGIVPYVTTLDLSSNNFSGGIPASIANCTYLNELMLGHNQFSGQIPAELRLLGRLKEFSITNNNLTGPIPTIGNFTTDTFANNPGLCGPPLDSCIPTTSNGSNTRVIAGAAVGGITFAAVFSGLVIFLVLRRRVALRKKDDDPEGNNWTKILKGSKGIKVSMFGKSVSKMKLSDLMKATNNFTKSNIIGSGRTGAMYKGQLGDDTPLMVKRLQDSKHSEKEFISEISTLGQMKHQNLVPLLGFCIAKSERLLVYEYMPNGTLHDNLHLMDEGRKAMEWSLRLKVGLGAARGFAWLHHNCIPRIIHRNISSKCILLDKDFEPKISDFGLARLMNPIDTHLSTFVNGEFGDLGYVAPEYARTLVATLKGDVYNFGIVLLELVTGESPTHVTRAPESFKGNLVEWIIQLSENSQLQDAIDRFLLGMGVDSEVFQVLKVACSCVLSAPKERPTMFEVYQVLRAIGERYNFSTENEIMILTDNGDSDCLEELIVAQ